ncbi:FAD binding domain-containing protein [Caproicibacter sp.]|uniref:FAD binding domain-containing protein n=1 Tax=Caproicibacter sp. TaxID=2814884 RepID=UPI00398A3A2C
MIPFDFEYDRPDTIEEALTVFRQLDAERKNPMFFGGGTEIISMARMGNVKTGAVVDLKAIPECRVFEYDKDRLLIGSALTLSDLVEAKRFPLLDHTAGRIADHTMQCKITFGGNLASTIIYRETVLPLLLTDAVVTVATQDGLRDYKITQIFRERLQLPRGEFLVRASIEKRWLSAPYIHVKKTKNEKVDYPLLTVACLKADDQIRMAFSGLLPHPFRNLHWESLMNDKSLSFPERAEQISALAAPHLVNNLDGSAEFRKFVLNNTLINVLQTLKGA